VNANVGHPSGTLIRGPWHLLRSRKMGLRAVVEIFEICIFPNLRRDA
jgi:hypothetical protein